MTIGDGEVVVEWENRRSVTGEEEIRETEET